MEISRMSPTRQALTLLTVGVSLGITIWVCSPWLTGKTEPWDGDTPIWSLSWLSVAVIGGLVGRISGVCLPIGYALGQMLITIPSVLSSEFGALGWWFIGDFAAVAVLVTLSIVAATNLLRYLWRKRSATGGGS